jgi:hypothetical protein
MLTIITIFAGFLLIISFGYQLSKILLPNKESLEHISLGYFLGIGVFTYIWFLLNWAGIPYNLISGFVILLLLNLVLFIVYKLLFKTEKRKPAISLSFFEGFDTIQKILLGVIIFLCISALIQTIYWPVRYWDSLVLYDFRARVFAQTGFMQEAISRGYFFGYPLLTSLAHTWVYLLGGSNPSFIYAILYISLLVNFFFNLNKLNIGKTSALFLTASVAISPRLFDHTQWADTNLPYSIFIILGSVYFYFGIKDKQFGSYVVSALLIGLGIWTRNTEPFWLSYTVLAIFLAIIIRKWYWPFVYTGLVAFFMMPWRIFQSIYGGGGDVNVVNQVVSTTSDITQNLQISVLEPAFIFVMQNVVKMYQIYFILLAFIVLAKVLRGSKKWIFTILIFFNLVLTYAGTIIFVKFQPTWQSIPDSLSRMVMFIPPMIIFLLAELLSEIGNVNIKGHHSS